MRLFYLAFGFTFLSTISGKLAFSQTTAHFEVTVVDRSGAVIPAATVQIDAVHCFNQGSAKTDIYGNAQFDLKPGHHTVTVDGRRWFKPAIRQIDLQGNQPSALNIVMDVLNETYTVTANTFPTSSDTLILTNGTIVTGECLAEGNPKIVEAISIQDGKIFASGTKEDVMGDSTNITLVRDLHGAFVMPGLNDAHVHLGGAGQTKLNVDLTGASSLAEMLDRIKAKADHSPTGHWLTGGGWDHTLWTNKTLPTRQDLDTVTGDHPTLLERIDGHIAVANTAALKAAKITGQSKSPQGGSIDLDAKGEPTGILRDTAMEEFEKLIPPPTHDERREGLSLAIADALAHGLTSVQDNSEWDDFLTFEELEKEGKLGIRISEWLPFAAPLDELKAHRAHHDASDPMLHTGMLKGFMDGSLGSRTAALKAPYADDAKNSGLARYDQAKLNAMAVERAQAGFQNGFHAIGDLATSMALEAFSQPVGDGKLVATGHRDRIEHAQVVDPADITRFAKLGVIASMQPNHLLTDMNWAEDRLGPQRAAYSYAWKAYLDQGVVLAFGTDYPVEPVTPFRGIYAAVTRMNEAGTKTYFPENKLSIGQALYAYTQGSAYAEFAEQHKGKLAPGYEADFVILDRNLLTIAPAEILKTKVLETVVAGKTAYKAQP